MSVGEGSLSGIHAASFCYYKAQPQPITASTRLRFASPKLLPSVATSGTRGTLSARAGLSWLEKGRARIHAGMG
jgi:hypothetical protein